MPPDLSIVIPTYNRSDLLRACLATVVRYCPPNTQILVVDDASSQEVASAVAGSFPGVEVVRLKRRGGFCKAANAGIALAEATIVEMLNDDTEVTPGWALPALAAFRDPEVGAVAPLVLRWPDGERIDSAGDRYFVGGVAGKRGNGKLVGPDYLRPGPVFGASASSAFYRREALTRVGGFPESFGAYFEDVDLSFRLNRAGYRVQYEPGSRVLHHVSASHGFPRRKMQEQLSCNEEKVFWRNLPGWTLARAVPVHLGVLAAKAWRRWQEGTLIPFLCGRLRALAGLPELLRHRRQLNQLGSGTGRESWGLESHYWES